MRLMVRRTDIALLLISVGLVAYYVAVGGGGFPLDDSWIHQTYGRNLGQFGEWAFLRGQASAASTSPLYTVLLALGYALGLPYALWTHALGALSLAGAGMLTVRLAERVDPRARWLPLIAGLAVVGNWHLIWAAASGMETMLFSAFTLLLIYLGWREADQNRALAVNSLLRRGLVFGGVAALTTLARPEGIALAGLVWLTVLASRVQQTRRNFAFWTLAAAAGFGILMAPYALYNLRVTGGLLPDTAAAKQAEYAGLLALSIWERMGLLLIAVGAGVQLLLVPGFATYVSQLSIRISDWWRSLLFMLPALWPVALVVLYALRLPANYQHGRYVIPGLPAFLLSGVVGMAWLVASNRRSAIRRVLTQVVVLSSAVVAVVFALVVGPGAYRQDVAVINEEMVASALWVRDNLPEGELLAVHDIGAVGYFAPRPILDLAGLVSPEVVPVIRDADGLWALMQARDARYLLAFPDQIPGQNTQDPRLCLIFSSNGTMAQQVGAANMAVYALAFDEPCLP